MFSLGADPECFLQDASGAFVSAIDRIGGTKQQPRPLPIGDGFAVQEDNVALEYNIPPSLSKDQFKNNINRAMSFLSDYVSQQGLHLADVSAVEFPMRELIDPRALEFGCDPDFNAWENGKRNPRPKASNMALRSCGGHVHVGYQFKSKKDVQEFIRHMDLFTVGAVLMDKGELRKELYGKWGAFRYKPYGCEYRTLSNFWVFSDELIEWVWDSVNLAMDAWQNKKINIDEDRDLLHAAINENNKRAAEALINKHNLLVYA